MVNKASIQSPRSEATYGLINFSHISFGSLKRAYQLTSECSPLTNSRQLCRMEPLGVVVGMLFDLWRRPEDAGERLQGVQESLEMWHLNF